MAYREDEVTGRTNLSDNDDNGPNSRQIRSEIENTRREMDRNLDALESKLTPTQLAMEAWGLFRGGSTAGASRLWRIAKQHPGPAAVIGVGIAWMLSDNTKGSDDRAEYRAEYGYRPGYAGAYGYSGRRGYTGTGYAGTTGGYETGYAGDYDQSYDEGEGRVSSALHSARDTVSGAAGTAKDAVTGAASTAKDAVVDAASTAKDAVIGAKDRVAEAAGTAREKASELSWQAREQARYRTRQARVGFWETMEERPMALGAAAIALGVVAGLMIPSTRKEDELMGETRDRLMERAKEVGGEALEKGKQVATVAVDTLKEEAERQDLTPEKLAEKVRTVAKEATNTVKEEGKRQASDLKETAKGGTTGTPGMTGNAGGDFGSTTPTTGGNVTTSSVTGGPQGVEQHEPEFTRK
ncbi:MAG TPA: DUF3618 domain-containing protein [Thermoanaerobaculia bacterium]|jgi:hypothetical protein|nr:DUF3618 domain-containing protein [Thermoanaerobaculia bacterium]